MNYLAQCLTKVVKINKKLSQQDNLIHELIKFN